MSGPRYEIDDEGNLVEPAADDGVTAGPAAGEERVPVSAEQARRTVRAILLSEVLGVLILVGAAAIYADYRVLILAVAAVYAFFAAFAYRYLRRSIYKQVEQGPPA